MPYNARQRSRLLDSNLIRKQDTRNEVQRLTETVLKRQLFAVEQQSVNRLWKTYRTTYRTLSNIASAVAERYGIDTLNGDAAAKRWRDSFTILATQQVNAMLEPIAAEGLRGSVAAWYGGYYGHAWQMDVMTPGDVNIRAVKPSPTTIAGELSQQGLLREDVYDDMIRNLLGSEWRQLYQVELDDLILRIRRAIWAGMGAGEGIPQIMSRVAQAMGVQINRNDKSYRANFNRVQTLTRTLVNKASNIGAWNVYKQNADILAGYQWLTAKDERVCKYCVQKAGNIYPLSDDSGLPPEHGNCRCTIIPYFAPASELPDEDWSTIPTFPDWAKLIGIEWLIDDFLAPDVDLGDSRWGDEEEMAL